MIIVLVDWVVCVVVSVVVIGIFNWVNSIL